MVPGDPILDLTDLTKNGCMPDLFSSRTDAVFRSKCAVCDEELSFDEQVNRQLVCIGCKTAIKTFRAAIGS